jgi:hypothetical protein
VDTVRFLLTIPFVSVVCAKLFKLLKGSLTLLGGVNFFTIIGCCLIGGLTEFLSVLSALIDLFVTMLGLFLVEIVEEKPFVNIGSGYKFNRFFNYWNKVSKVLNR